MKLTDARKLFEKCRKRGANGLIVRKHCWFDHSERKFSRVEILNLLQGEGVLRLNDYPSAKPGSFLWFCKDRNSSRVQIVVLLDSEKIIAIAISAYRKLK